MKFLIEMAAETLQTFPVENAHLRYLSELGSKEPVPRCLIDRVIEIVDFSRASELQSNGVLQVPRKTDGVLSDPRYDERNLTSKSHFNHLL